MRLQWRGKRLCSVLVYARIRLGERGLQWMQVGRKELPLVNLSICIACRMIVQQTDRINSPTVTKFAGWFLRVGVWYSPENLWYLRLYVCKHCQPFLERSVVVAGSPIHQSQQEDPQWISCSVYPIPTICSGMAKQDSSTALPSGRLKHFHASKGYAASMFRSMIGKCVAISVHIKSVLPS